VRKVRKIKVHVVVCNLCGFKVTHTIDQIGVAAIESHYRVDHKGVEFNGWHSMHPRTIEI